MNTKMKRRIRKIVAGICLASAVAVAAIPADNSGIGMAQSQGPMETLDYNTDSNQARNGELPTPSDSPELTCPTGTSEKYSYRIMSNGSSWELSWEYKYFTTNSDNNDIGVICGYNDINQVPTLTLSSSINTGYEIVSTAEYNSWAETLKNVHFHLRIPNQDCTENIDGQVCTTRYSEAQKYFPTEYENLVSRYNSACAQYKQNHPEETGTPSLKILQEECNYTAFDFTGDQMSEENKLLYYCDTHNLSGYTLVSVSNLAKGLEYIPSPSTGSNNGNYKIPDENNVYVARTVDGSVITNTTDANGFKVISSQNVKAIGNEAFKNTQRVNTMVVAADIAYIGDNAFINSYIREVKFDGVLYIGNYVFKNCQYLTSVSFTEKTQTIGKEAFYNCPQLTTIEITKGIHEIGFGAFASCRNLTTVNMSDCEKVNIGEYAFFDCLSLSTVTFPTGSSQTAIGKAAFALSANGSASQMTEFTFPELICQYECAAECSPGEDSDTEHLYDEKGECYESQLGDYILANRSNLKTVTMPKNFGETTQDRVPANTFRGCLNLETVIFLENSREADFDEDLFRDVINPEFYVRGPARKSTGGTNGYAQPRLATWAAHTAAADYVPYVYTEDGTDHYEVGIEPYRYELAIDDTNGTATLQSCQFIDPDEQEDIDLLIVPGTVAKYTVTTLAEGCFDADSGSNSVKNYIKNLWVVDNSILEIGDSVFANCAKLETVLLGNSVQVIGEDAFANNQMLSAVVIGESIVNVEDGAFSDCPKLECVIWDSPNSYNLTTIAEDAFKTNSSVLYFVGDIESGYAPFEYAMGDHTINDHSIRICYVMPTVNTNNVTVNGGSSAYASARMMSNYSAYAYSPMALEGSCECIGCENCEDCSNGEDCDSCECCGDGVCECEDCDDCGCTKEPEESPVPPEGPSTPGEETATVQISMPAAAIYVIHDNETNENLLIDYPHYGDLPQDLRNIYEGKTTGESLNAEQWALLNATMFLKLPEEVTSIDIKSFLDNNNNNTNRANWIYISDTDNWLGGSFSQKDIYSNDNLTLSGAEDADLQERYEASGGYHAGLFSGYYVDIDSLKAYGDNPSNYQTKGNDWLLSIEMPGITSIPDYAFDSCERLQSVIISDACKSIGTGVFQNCTSLTAIGTGNSTKFIFDNYLLYEVLDNGTYELNICLPARGKDLASNGIYVNPSNDPLLSKVSSLGDNVFTNCDGIISIDLSDTSINTVPEETFRGCSRLTSVILPYTVKTIGNNAFKGTATSIDVTIPSDCVVTNAAFDDKNITTIWTYPDCDLIITTFGDPDHNKYSNIFTRYLGTVHTLTFLNDDYSVFLVLEVEDGRDGSYPKDDPEPKLPVHQGCAFDGWYFDNENTIYNVTENRVAVATFASRIFTITYLNDDGTVYEVIDVPEGYNGSYPAVDPTPKLAMHQGYKFSGWSFTNGNGVENVHENRQAVATFSLDGTNTPSANQPGNGSGNGNGGNGNGTASGNNTPSGNSASSNGITYTVTVENGAGGGNYEPGKVVTITAYAAPTGRVFDRWTTSNADIGFSNAYAVSTTFIMPSHDVKVTATYKQETASGNSANGNNNNNNSNGNNSGNGSSASGNNANGNNGKTDVTITTDTIDNNHKNLASATVSGSTDNFIVKITDSAAAYAAVEQALRAQYGDLSNVRFVGFDISLYDETGTRKIENTNGLAVTITIPIPDDLIPYAGNNRAAGVVNGALDPLTVKFTTIDGVPCMQFTATHFSPYTIYVNTNYLTMGVTDETPKTGDGLHPKWFLAAGLACFSVVLFAWKDKKRVAVK